MSVSRVGPAAQARSAGGAGAQGLVSAVPRYWLVVCAVLLVGAVALSFRPRHDAPRPTVDVAALAAAATIEPEPDAVVANDDPNCPAGQVERVQSAVQGQINRFAQSAKRLNQSIRASNSGTLFRKVDWNAPSDAPGPIELGALKAAGQRAHAEYAREVGRQVGRMHRDAPGCMRSHLQALSRSMQEYANAMDDWVVWDGQAEGDRDDPLVEQAREGRKSAKEAAKAALTNAGSQADTLRRVGQPRG